jgi:hypothetical protein
MAVTANQLLTRQDGVKRHYPVATGVTIYQGTAVYLTAGGYATNVTASGVNGFVGMAVGNVVNAGADGAKLVEVWATGDFELPSSGLTQADVGSTIYGSDNFTFSTTAGASGVPVGKIEYIISATVAVVSLRTVGTGTAQVAALTTITPADAVGTPDYAIAAVINSNAWGFASAQELISVLYVLQNLQQRMLNVESRMS